MLYRFNACALMLAIVLFLFAPAFALDTLGKDKIFIRFTNIRTDGGKALVRVNVATGAFCTYALTVAFPVRIFAPTVLMSKRRFQYPLASGSDAPKLVATPPPLSNTHPAPVAPDIKISVPRK